MSNKNECLIHSENLLEWAKIVAADLGCKVADLSFHEYDSFGHRV